jgi:hypothetical protein
VTDDSFNESTPLHVSAFTIDTAVSDPDPDLSADSDIPPPSNGPIVGSMIQLGLDPSCPLGYNCLTSSTPPDLSSLQVQILSLQEIVSDLLSKLHLSTSTTFTRDLSYLMTGQDVLLLQQYLNSHGFLLSTEGPGSPGHETTLFGDATRYQLIRFQKEHGISPAAGYFGPITRQYIQNH